MSNSFYLSRRDKLEAAVIGFVAGVLAFQYSPVAGRIFIGGAVFSLISAITVGGERIE